jgi:hypothetical protein
VMMHRIGMHGEVGYLVFRHRQTNANPRSRGKWRQNACVCVHTRRRQIFVQETRAPWRNEGVWRPGDVDVFSPRPPSILVNGGRRYDSISNLNLHICMHACK